MIGGDVTPPKPRPADKIVEPPEPLLSEPAEPLGYLKLDFREVELTEIDALATTSTVRFLVTNHGVDVMATMDKDAKKVIVWETTYRIPIISFENVLEIHLIRTSQDLLTNQLTRKTLGAAPLEFPAVSVVEAGEGSFDDLAIHFLPKGKKKSIARLTLGWQYRAAPNPYSDLDPLLLSPDQAVLTTILAMKVVDAPAGAIMRYFAYSMKAVDLFALAVKTEIAGTNELPQLFRGSSIATQVVSEFLALHGDAFLRDLLRPLVQKVLSKSPDVELDPSKLTKPREEKEQKAIEKRLTELCNTFLKGISSTVGNCPPAIREVCNLVHAAVEKKFIGKSHIALAGLLFLRFICPAIVTPDKICPGIECNQTSRRALLLVTKVLQNLANDVPFGENGKETYMAAMNPFLQANKNYATDIYKKVMKADKKGYDPSRYRRRVPIKVYEGLFTFASEQKLLAPAQCETIKDRVARELQPPAAATAPTNSQFNGKTSSSSEIKLNLLDSRSGSEMGINRSGSESRLITSTRSSPNLSPSISREAQDGESSTQSEGGRTPVKENGIERNVVDRSTPVKESAPDSHSTGKEASNRSSTPVKDHSLKEHPLKDSTDSRGSTPVKESALDSHSTGKESKDKDKDTGKDKKAKEKKTKSLLQM